MAKRSTGTACRAGHTPPPKLRTGNFVLMHVWLSGTEAAVTVSGVYSTAFGAFYQSTGAVC
jgi:hypothetical protein